MRLLIYSLVFPPDICSNAYILADIAEELVRRGHTVNVITTTPHYDIEHAAEKKAALDFGKKKWYRKSRFGNIDVFHISVSTRKGGKLQRIKTYFAFHYYAKKIARIEKINADIVLSQTPPFTVGFAGNSISKMLNARSVLLLQDLWVDSMIRKNKIKGLLRKLLLNIEKREYSKSDSICTIVPEMADVISEKIREPEKISVIPNFVDTDLYFPLEANDYVYEKYGVHKDRFVVSYVGNIGNAQDLRPLINYAEKKRDSGIQILIAGTGVKLPYYRELVETKRLSDVVSFLGYVPREESSLINAISNICLVMLADHIVSTSFPSKIYTIMAMKKPVLIACNKNGIAGKFAEDNKIGWAVDINNQEEFDKILDYLSSKPGSMDSFGENAYEIILKEYSKEAVTDKYESLFNRLIRRDNYES